MRHLAKFVCCVAVAVTWVRPTAAQDLNPVLKQSLQRLIQTEQQLTPAQRSRLSSGLQMMLALAHRKLDGVSVAPDAGVRPRSAPLMRRSAPLPLSPAGSGPVAVSGGSLDYALSRAFGFSQNQTSTAWCGQNLVTGFNNTATADEGLFNGQAISLGGVAYSHDGGQTFTDIGGLNAGTPVFNAAGGDPVVLCTSPSRFYYASLFFTGVPIDEFSFNPQNGVAINISDDGGQTWSEPIPAVLADCCNQLFDREWLAVDPSNPSRLYLTYTTFAFNDTPDGPCPQDFSTTIEFVRSFDGGHTWSVPAQLALACGGTSLQEVGASQVAVGPGGQVYVSYLLQSLSNFDRKLLFRASADQGASFGIQTTIAQPTPIGIESILQGFFLGNEEPSMTVDTSNGPNRGAIYVVWADGRNRSTVEVLSPTGQYNFGDILISKSSDSGATWSAPVAASPTPPEFTGAGRDQFQPAVAVDATGRVGVCYYDRSNDPENNLVDRFCSASTDGGASFPQRARLTVSSWIPAHFVDFDLPSHTLSDYDTVARDALGVSPGFFSAFQVEVNGNLNVQGGRF